MLYHNLIKTEQYTSATTFNTTESEFNYLEKPVTVSVHVRAGDLAGNDFADNTDTLLMTHFTYDKNGNVLTVTTPNVVTTHFTYDNLNRQTQTNTTNTDEYGQTVPVSTSVTYTWDGKTQTSTDANGNVSSAVYDQRGLLIQTVDASGNTTAKYYDTAGRLMAIVAPGNYDALKTLAQMSRTEYTYDQMGRVKTITQIYYDSRTDLWVTFVEKAYQYDTLGNVTKELDALGYASGTGTTVDEKITSGYGTLYTYNLAGKVITKLDPVSGERELPFAEQYTYDALGRVISVTNANGVKTCYYYDGAGKVLFTKVQAYEFAPEQTVKSNTYDLLGNILTQTDGNGSTTTFVYNALGKVRQTTTPGDATISALTAYSQYNTSGNLAKMWTSTGRQEAYTYDNLGKVLSKTQSAMDGSSAITTTYCYDKNGNVRFATDGNGNVTTAVYDAMNRVLTQTKGSAATGYQTTTYTYNANGKALTTTDWRGNTSTNVYDAMNRLIEQKDAYNHTAQSFVYNNNSVQVTSTDALGHLTTYVYDRDNRLLETIDPLGHSISQTYDDVCMLDSKTDGNGNVTYYRYDEFNRLTWSGNDSSVWFDYQYDLNGNVISIRISFWDVITEVYTVNETLFEYNAANQLVRSIKDGGRAGEPGSYTYDLTKVQSCTYAADGQLATKTDRNGITTTYTYDIHGRLLSQTVGALSISYTYDSNGNVLTMTDGTGTTTRAYDAFNRTTSKTVPYIGTSTYNYDITAGMDAGCTAQTTTDPKNNITCKAYDRVGRIFQVIADGMTTVYTYFDNGSIQNVVYSDGSREDYTYTDDNRLETLTNRKADSTIIDTYSYTYDDAHNMLTKIDARGTSSYTYDSQNRLVTVTEPSGKVTSYTFDASGNRANQTVVLSTDTTITTYTYDTQNRLTGTAEQLNGVTTETVVYTYDNNGNQLSKTSTAYIAGIAQTPVTEQTNTYDLFNQLISTVTSGGVTVINTYNGDGLRVGKSVNGTSIDSSTRYLYEYDRVVLEVSVSGIQTGRNVYGINLLTRQVGGDTLIYMYNGHADVTALLSITGVIAATYYYDAFGNILGQTGTINNNILYAGYQYDFETGLYYLNARMYDPVTARFMQEDTYAGEYNDPLSLNLYTYCKNEPLMYADPTGHRQVEGYETGGHTTHTEPSRTVDDGKYQTRTKDTAARWDKWDALAVGESGSPLLVEALRDKDRLNSIVGACKTQVIANAKAAGENLSSKEIEHKAEAEAIKSVLMGMYIDPDSVKPTIAGRFKAGASALVGVSAGVWQNAFYKGPLFLPSILEQRVLKTDQIDRFSQRICDGMDNFLLSNSQIIDKESYNIGKPGGAAIFLLASLPEMAQSVVNLGRTSPKIVQGFSSVGSSISGGATALIRSRTISVSVDVGALAQSTGQASFWTGQVISNINGLKDGTAGGSSSEGSSTSSKIGANGTRVDNQSYYGKQGRIDIENPAPGIRDGQIHLQTNNGEKWYYDIANKVFYNQKTGVLASSSVQKILNEPWAQKAISKGMMYLGEGV